MDYTIIVLACIAQDERPNITRLVERTGISRSKVFSVFKEIENTLGITVSLGGEKSNKHYYISHWGVCDENKMQSRLMSVRLKEFRDNRKLIVDKKKAARIYSNLNSKQFFIHSSRLEGMSDIESDIDKKEKISSLFKKYGIQLSESI